MNPLRSNRLPDIPGYRVLDRLGAGGMGVVVQAENEQDGQVYAIKMLLGGPRASYLDLARFRIEAEAYACLDHPGIVENRQVGGGTVREKVNGVE